MADTSKEAVERLAARLAGLFPTDPDEVAATLRALRAERDDWRAAAELATELAERLATEARA